MKDLTVIIPIYKLEEEAQVQLLIECVKSITNQTKKPETVLFIGKKDVCDGAKETFVEVNKLLKDNKIKSKTIKHEGSGTIQQQVNLASNEVKTKFFTVVESDDTLYRNWFENVEKQVENDVEDIALYLPITYNINIRGEIIRLSNEVVWSATISDDDDKLGFISNELLKTFSDFQVTSGVFRTEVFKSIGGLKENIEVFFWNELLLRLTNKEHKIYVIPKYGGNHLVGLPYSFVMLAEKKYTNEELDFWSNVIGEEYFYIEDRVIEKQ